MLNGKGMEMMISAAIKAMGIEPQAMLAQFAALQNFVVAFVRRQDTAQRRIEQKLDAILSDLGLDPSKYTGDVQAKIETNSTDSVHG